jgi:hypothetical protein
VDQILSVLQDNAVWLGDWFRWWGGNNSNIVDVPDANGVSQWYIRPGTSTTFPLIDLDAAISSIDPVPEPATAVLVGAAAAFLLRRRRRRAPADPR